MLNYIRASVGQLRTRSGDDGTFQTIVCFFDDADPEAMRAALREARDAFPHGRVHVWRRAATVPSSVREIGDMRPVGSGAMMRAHEGEKVAA